MKKKPAKSARLCAMGAPEAEICKTANALAGLFNRVEIDAPDALLTHGPAPKNVVDALRVLLDVMFPGKISATPVEGAELGVFLIRRLSEAWRLLHREIRRALPYRWIGEAARVEGARPPKIEISTAKPTASSKPSSTPSPACAGCSSPTCRRPTTAIPPR